MIRSLLDADDKGCDLLMKPRHYGIDIFWEGNLRLICGYDEDQLTFVTVGGEPRILHSIDAALVYLVGEMESVRNLAFCSLFCLTLFDAWHYSENNLKFPPSS